MAGALDFVLDVWRNSKGSDENDQEGDDDDAEVLQAIQANRGWVEMKEDGKGNNQSRDNGHRQNEVSHKGVLAQNEERHQNDRAVNETDHQHNENDHQKNDENQGRAHEAAHRQPPALGHDRQRPQRAGVHDGGAKNAAISDSNANAANASSSAIANANTNIEVDVPPHSDDNAALVSGAGFKLPPGHTTRPAPGAELHQPYGPYGVFFVAGDTSNVQRTAPRCPGVDKAAWESTGCCSSAYFIGGGKAGSTTMAVLLKHSPDNNYAAYDPDGPFADAGKEVCWALHGSTSPSHYFSHFKKCLDCPLPAGVVPRVALDACPRYTDAGAAGRIACVHPDTRFIMLAREPVRRLISHYNDHRIRGGLRTEPDTYMRGIMRVPIHLDYVLSDYATILSNFLRYFPPKQILVVQSEALSRADEDVQRLMDIVCDHLGVAHRNVSTHHGNANSIVDKHRYLMPSNTTLCELHESFRPRVELFHKMLGAKLDWEDY
jgi:hypothetical protein